MTLYVGMWTIEKISELNKIREIRIRPTERTGLFPLSEEVLEFVERGIAYVDG